MMDKKPPFWKRVRENLDTYVAIVLALISTAVSLVVFILSLTNAVSIVPVLPLISATLGALGVALLRDRSREEKIAQSEEKIAQSLEELLLALRNERKNQVFARQGEAYSFLIDIIKKQDTVKEATFIQYSCTKSSEVLSNLLRKGAKVTIFAQHEDFPEEIGSQRQVKRIKGMIDDLPDHLGMDLQNPANIEVYKYTVPGSLSAIKIDDRILLMGWYTYDYAKPTNYAGDKIEVSGHDRAAIVAWQGTDEFRALNETFMLVVENYRANAKKVLYT